MEGFPNQNERSRQLHPGKHSSTSKVVSAWVCARARVCACTSVCVHVYVCIVFSWIFKNVWKCGSFFNPEQNQLNVFASFGYSTYYKTRNAVNQSRNQSTNQSSNYVMLFKTRGPPPNPPPNSITLSPLSKKPLYFFFIFLETKFNKFLPLFNSPNPVSNDQSRSRLVQGKSHSIPSTNSTQHSSFCFSGK